MSRYDDSSFADILSRTRKNIDRISQKYGAEHSSSQRLQLDNFRGNSRKSIFDAHKENLHVNPKDSSPTGRQKRQPSSSSNTTDYDDQFYHQHDRSAVPLVPSPPPPSHRRHDPASGGVQDDILRRLEQLEKHQSENNNLLQRQREMDDRVIALERAVDTLRNTVDTLTSESKDQRREITKLSGQVTSHNTLLEILQHDVESRRSTVAKLDSWVRQGELWRSELDSQLSELKAHLKQSQRQNNENKENIADRVSRADLDSFRDRVHISTQQAVAASLAAWHDKVELSVRQLERQVAALRLGGTLNVTSTGNDNNDDGCDTNVKSLGLTLSDEEVKKALLTQQPSEMLLKGVVSSEMRHMENDLEQKLQLHMVATVRSNLIDATKELKTDIRQFVERSVSQVLEQEGLGGVSSSTNFDDQEQPTSSALSKMSSLRKEKQRELQYLSDRVDDLSAALISLQESQGCSETAALVEVRNLERRIEECVSMSNAYMTTVQSKASDMDTSNKNSENEQRKRHEDLRAELLGRLVEVSQAATDERVEIDRRIGLAEKLVSNIAERVDMSKNIFEGLLSTSPEIKRFQTTSVKLEGLLVEFSALRGDLRELEKVSSRMQANTASRDDVAEVKERLAQVEPLVRKVEEGSALQQQCSSDIRTLQHDIEATNLAVAALKGDSSSHVEKIARVEFTLKSLSQDIAAAKEASDEKMRQLYSSSNERHRDEVSDLQRSLQHLQSTVSAMSSDHSNLSSSVKGIGNQVVTTKAEVDKLNRAISFTESDGNRRDGDLQAVKKQLDDCKESIRKQSQEHQQFAILNSADIQKSKSAVAAVEQSLQEYRKSLNDATRKVDVLEARVLDVSTTQNIVLKNFGSNQRATQSYVDEASVTTSKSLAVSGGSFCSETANNDVMTNHRQESSSIDRWAPSSHQGTNISNLNDTITPNEKVKNGSDNMIESHIKSPLSTSRESATSKIHFPSPSTSRNIDLDGSFEDILYSSATKKTDHQAVDSKTNEEGIISSSSDDSDTTVKDRNQKEGENVPKRSKDNEDYFDVDNSFDSDDIPSYTGENLTSEMSSRVGDKISPHKKNNASFLDSSFDDDIPFLDDSPKKLPKAASTKDDDESESSDDDKSTVEENKTMLSNVDEKRNTDLDVESSFEDNIPSLGDDSPVKSTSSRASGHSSNIIDDGSDSSSDESDGEVESGQKDNILDDAANDDVNSFDVDSSFDTDHIPSLPTSPSKSNPVEEKPSDTDLKKAREFVKSKSSNIFGFSALEDSVDLSPTHSDDEKSKLKVSVDQVEGKNQSLNGSDSDSSNDNAPKKDVGGVDDNIMSFSSVGDSYDESLRSEVEGKKTRVLDNSADVVAPVEESTTVEDYIKAMSFGSTSDIITADDDILAGSLSTDIYNPTSSNNIDSSSSTGSFDLEAEKEKRAGAITDTGVSSKETIATAIKLDVDDKVAPDHFENWDDDSESDDEADKSATDNVSQEVSGQGDPGKVPTDNKPLKSPTKLSFKEKLALKREALKQEKKLASSTPAKDSVDDSTSSDSDSHVTKSSKQGSSDLKTTSKKNEEDTKPEPTVKASTTATRDRLTNKFGKSKFDSSDEDDDDSQIDVDQSKNNDKSGEGEDMVTSFDNSFDDSF